MQHSTYTIIILLVCIVGCDTTVKNDASIEGDWTGSANGILATEDGSISEDVELEITYDEAKGGELSGRGMFFIFDSNGGSKDTIELDATGLRSSNTVESAFVSETDTVVYNGSVKNEGAQIEGKLDWNRYENTANVVLNRQ